MGFGETTGLHQYRYPTLEILHLIDGREALLKDTQGMPNRIAIITAHFGGYGVWRLWRLWRLWRFLRPIFAVLSPIQ